MMMDEMEKNEFLAGSSSTAKFDLPGGGKRQRRTRGQFFNTCTTLPEYFSRMLDYQQMDLDATCYQMVTLCVSPSKVYKSAYYRKQTKNRWSRDDPAFAVIQVLFLIVTAVAWAISFEAEGLLYCMFLIVHDVFVEWLGFGVALASLSWWFANNHLRVHATPGLEDTLFVAQTVEWQFAFDIHCNSFFVLFLLIHVLQMFLVPLMVSDTFVSLLLANTLYAFGTAIYFYITFLGYMALPFLHKTEKFLYPIVAIGGIYFASIMVYVLFGVHFNMAVMSMNYYYG